MERQDFSEHSFIYFFFKYIISVSGMSAKVELTQQLCAGTILASAEQILELKSTLRNLTPAGEPEESGGCGQTQGRASGTRLRSPSSWLGCEHCILGETLFSCVTLPTTGILLCILVEERRNAFSCVLKDCREGRCLNSPRLSRSGEAGLQFVFAVPPCSAHLWCLCLVFAPRALGGVVICVMKILTQGCCRNESL